MRNVFAVVVCIIATLVLTGCVYAGPRVFSSYGDEADRVDARQKLKATQLDARTARIKARHRRIEVSDLKKDEVAKPKNKVKPLTVVNADRVEDK